MPKWEHLRRWRIRKEHGFWTVYLLHDYGGNSVRYRVVTARGSHKSAIAYVGRVEANNYRREQAA